MAYAFTLATLNPPKFGTNLACGNGGVSARLRRMAAHIDPVEALLDGIATPFRIGLYSTALFVAAWLTSLAAGSRAAGDIPILGTIFFLDGAFFEVFCQLSFIAIPSAIYLWMLGHIPPRIAVFLIYSLGIGFFACDIWRGDRWWLGILVYITITLYYWYVFPLMIRQIQRNRELNEEDL